MEKLITHLQETLDEDEAAKEALLHLRNTKNADEVSRKSHTVGQMKLPLKCSNESGNIFLLELVVASIMGTCSGALDLPLKIAASRLELNVGLLRNICTTQTFITHWSINLLQCLHQIVQVYELAIQRGVCTASGEQWNRLNVLKQEIVQLRDAPRGSGEYWISGISCKNIIN